MGDGRTGAVDFYNLHGWYAPPAGVSEDVIRPAEDVVRSIDTAPRDRSLPKSLERFLHWEPGTPRPAALNQYIALQYKAIFDLAAQPQVAATAAMLMGSTAVRIFNTALIAKRPDRGAQFANVGWHADRAYWQTCSSPKMVTAWIPLQTTTAEMGALTMIRGSHRWADTETVSRFRTTKSFLTEDAEALRDELDQLDFELTFDTMELKAGQYSFHHPLTLHGSGVNISDRTRAAISVHFQDVENRFQAVFDSNGVATTYVHDALVRRTPTGDPDYSDPDFCPLVWPAS